MNSNKSKKQSEANKLNGKKGGVKTEEGKTISAKNATKHGIFSQIISEEERDLFLQIHMTLKEDLCPNNSVQRIILERLAGHILQMRRISFAKEEFNQLCRQPGKTINHFESLDQKFIEVVEKPYEPIVRPEDFEKLMSLYHRYETSAENRFYRAVREFNLANF